MKPAPGDTFDAAARLDEVYRTAPVGMCLVDTKLRYLQINQVLAGINGFSIDYHIGKTITEVIPKLAPYIVPLYEQVLKFGEPITDVDVQSSAAEHGPVSRSWIVNYFPFFDNEHRYMKMSH